MTSFKRLRELLGNCCKRNKVHLFVPKEDPALVSGQGMETGESGGPELPAQGQPLELHSLRRFTVEPLGKMIFMWPGELGKGTSASTIFGI
ncbi:Hypothetical predicted protein [Podarcis lilfordi]|uniref:Uncharacterized protein n=1 Tax=Podarcis lilfordi TaxID=74358 RepID=A0AA35LDE7_9SAUR|nr:Hypothetical predicted protein [Podarcis lilfordi]